MSKTLTEELRFSFREVVIHDTPELLGFVPLEDVHTVDYRHGRLQAWAYGGTYPPLEMLKSAFCIVKNRQFIANRSSPEAFLKV